VTANVSDRGGEKCRVVVGAKRRESVQSTRALVSPQGKQLLVCETDNCRQCGDGTLPRDGQADHERGPPSENSPSTRKRRTGFLTLRANYADQTTQTDPRSALLTILGLNYAYTVKKISDSVKMHCTDISLKYQYCRTAVGMGIPMESPVGILYGMGVYGMGWVWAL